MLPLFQFSFACGNDDSDLDTDTETGTETETETETESETEMPPDLGVCEPIIVSIEDILTTLEGLTIDEFLEASYNEITKRSPQSVTANELAQSFGMDDDMLDDVSFEYQLQTYDLVIGMLAMMRKNYVPDELTYDQRVELGAYDFYMDDIVRREDFIYHPPQNEWDTDPARKLYNVLNYYHVVDDAPSAQAYISRLTQVDDQFACFRENLLEVKDMDLLPSQSDLWGYRNFNDPALLPGNAQVSSFYIGFAQSLEKIDDIGDAEKAQLLADAEAAIETSLIPAHLYLKELILELEKEAFEDDFLWQYPDGDAYYDYLLSHNIGREITADEAMVMGLREVTRIREEMDVFFETLGYPEDETLTQLYDRVETDAGYVPQESVMSTIEAMVAENKIKALEAFDLMPQTELVIVNTGYFAYGPSYDGIEPGEYYVNADIDAPVYALPSVTYHESIPGHHFQISLALEKPVPEYRSVWLYGAFEGWALYAERLAKDMGWYDEDIYGDLGRLQAEMLRAVRIVTDNGLQARKWTEEEAVQYVAETIGLSDDDVYFATPQQEVNRYINSPGTVPGYKIGERKFLEVRQTAMDALGDSFDLKAFHNAVLSAGNVNFDTLDFIVEHLIESNGKAPELPEKKQPKAPRRNIGPRTVIID